MKIYFLTFAHNRACGNEDAGRLNRLKLCLLEFRERKKDGINSGLRV